jgi:hypothetical protein
LKSLILAFLGLATFAAAWTLEPKDANAAVCARGVYRAGCVGPRGAVVVRRRPVVYAPRYRVYGPRVRVYRRW